MYVCACMLTVVNHTRTAMSLVCMYICVCMSLLCMYVCMHVCTYVRISGHTYVTTGYK